MVRRFRAGRLAHVATLRAIRAEVEALGTAWGEFYSGIAYDLEIYESTANQSGMKANEAAGVDSPRIPIQAGFYIQVRNGRAINPGGRDKEAISLVETWIEQNPGHAELRIAQEWLQLKRVEDQEVDEVHRKREKRAEVDALVEKTSRESGVTDKRLIEITREMVRKQRGVDTDE